jgi:beta-1,4-N-acetylglucosaminyltransferase
MLVFVTVGTTMFDDLVQAVCSSAVQTQLAGLGYTRLLVQSGRTDLAQIPDSALEVSWYNYKPSLTEVSWGVACEV